MRVKNAGAPEPITPLTGHVRPPEHTDDLEDADEAGSNEEARTLRHALEAVEASPEDRELRIKALRAAILNGTYEPDASEVARKLLDNGF